jgi:hypothetical protein
LLGEKIFLVLDLIQLKLIGASSQEMNLNLKEKKTKGIEFLKQVLFLVLALFQLQY